MEPEEFEGLSLTELSRDINALAKRVLSMEDSIAQLDRNYDALYGVLKKLLGK